MFQVPEHINTNQRYGHQTACAELRLYIHIRDSITKHTASLQSTFHNHFSNTSRRCIPVSVQDSGHTSMNRTAKPTGPSPGQGVRPWEEGAETGHVISKCGIMLEVTRAPCHSCSRRRPSGKAGRQHWLKALDAGDICMWFLPPWL